MLLIKNFSKKYGKNFAVYHIDFAVNKGEVCILLGANGAGKSTTIQSLVGILNYDGMITLDGVSTKNPESRKKISYVPEIPSLFKMLTVREHINYMCKAYGKEVDSHAIDMLLEKFDMLDKQNKFGDELSKGMMQKVSICCALAVNPDLIILDEPMVGLDPKAIKELKNEISNLKNQGKTVIISTHMLEMVDTLWDRVIMLKQGRIVGDYIRDENSGKDLEDLYFSLNANVMEEELSHE